MRACRGSWNGTGSITGPDRSGRRRKNFPTAYALCSNLRDEEARRFADGSGFAGGGSPAATPPGTPAEWGSGERDTPARDSVSKSCPWPFHPIHPFRAAGDGRGAADFAIFRARKAETTETSVQAGRRPRHVSMCQLDAAAAGAGSVAGHSMATANIGTIRGSRSVTTTLGLPWERRGRGSRYNVHRSTPGPRSRRRQMPFKSATVPPSAARRRMSSAAMIRYSA